MGEMNSDQIAVLERRLEHFDEFRKQRVPVLVDFAERLGFEEAHEIVKTPSRFLPALSQFMRDQVIERDDRDWIMVRVGYFVGELLVERLDGCWIVERNPMSKLFGRYVIGEFSRVKNRRAVADPFGVAQEYVDSPPPRDLQTLFESVVRDVESL